MTMLNTNGNALFTYSFVPGNYAPSDLISIINGYIAGNGNGVAGTFSYTANTGIFHFSPNTGASLTTYIWKFSQIGSIFPSMGYGNVDYLMPNLSTPPLVISTVQNFDPPCLYLGSIALTAQQIPHNVFKPSPFAGYPSGSSSLIERIPTGQSVGVSSLAINYEPREKKMFLAGVTQKIIDFTLYDDRGNVFSLNNPVNGWQIQLVIYYY